ncbi:MAG: HNH endonuclease [Candidatus Poribacteria bacterium]|nr:HNH endonuclease [Candidatus Poribacteria bacterium]
MPSLFLRRMSEEERNDLVKRLHSSQNGSCFICEKPIDMNVHAGHVEIDHIEPIAGGGKDAPENFALTHASCNRVKQASDLRVARILSRFQDIVDEVEKENRSPNLGDILNRYEGSRYDLPVAINETTIKVSFPDIGENDLSVYPIQLDQMSGFRSAFLSLPIQYLHHDDHINPRAIGGNLRKLVEEFHKKIPQLHISLGWIDTSQGTPAKVRIFDGQHKAAAQVLLGTTWMPVRVFIDPNRDTLLTANTHAGTTLRQIAFDKSVQRSLGSSLLADRMDRYRKSLGKEDDDESFSERDLVNHFKGESREVRRYITDRVRASVTNHVDNKLRDYIDFGGRGVQKPLSYSTIDKTFYSFFILGEVLETPFNHKAEEGTNPRQLEIEQIVRLMNIIAEKVYVGMFDPSLGTRRIEYDIVNGKDIPEPHLRAFRMAKEEVIYNWLSYLGQIVQNFFITNGLPIDVKKLFQYNIPETCWGNIENFIDALSGLSLWVNRDLASSVFGGKQNYSYWQSIFETGATPDGFQVMSSGINLMDMIKQNGE